MCPPTKISSSPTPNGSRVSIPDISSQSELKSSLKKVKAEVEHFKLLLGVELNCASSGTWKSVPPLQRLANISTSVLFAIWAPTSAVNAQSGRIKILSLFANRQLQYAQLFIWSDSDASVITVTEFFLFHPPLPDVPESEPLNHTVNETLKEHLHLFKIVTPINIEQFKELLLKHLNRSFVESVLKGL
ncbi:hypothetical protein OBBRIDRAFT_802588 [Obba rivulosa]|uniref:Uncharacterized protein n=1 Tax=Obba rivulosa TaxID=1052685 RepID=A0A8E2DP05_9APHY|nr:hypothetical protein OBBRIDRAFT_802588 [Obba rivulosa]